MSTFKVPIDTIKVSKFKVRTWQDPNEFAKLRDSIRKQGML